LYFPSVYLKLSWGLCSFYYMWFYLSLTIVFMLFLWLIFVFNKGALIFLLFFYFIFSFPRSICDFKYFCFCISKCFTIVYRQEVKLILLPLFSFIASVCSKNYNFVTGIFLESISKKVHKLFFPFQWVLYFFWYFIQQLPRGIVK